MGIEMENALGNGRETVLLPESRTPDIAASENVRFFLKWPSRRV